MARYLSVKASQTSPFRHVQRFGRFRAGAVLIADHPAAVFLDGADHFSAAPPIGQPVIRIRGRGSSRLPCCHS